MAATEVIGTLLRSLATRDGDGRSCEIFVSVTCRSLTNSLRRGASLKNDAIKKPLIRVIAKSTFFMIRVDLEKPWVSVTNQLHSACQSVRHRIEGRKSGKYFDKLTASVRPIALLRIKLTAA